MLVGIAATHLLFHSTT